MTRVLLIEDDNDLRSMLAEVLRRGGYEVREARNGGEAVGLFRQCPADLVVTDLLMPEKDGLETLMELRMEQPVLRILAMSGGGEFPAQLYLRMAGRLGAALVLAKPFGTTEFLAAVQTLTQSAG
jgi:DNA-binding response OmpR family regulator